ncbi:MAG TPA: hypothetical protein VHD62_04560 [Opitutaceae bacterium]|nr:hypothetical protein [Opitutaceae bacterium]
MIERFVHHLCVERPAAGETAAEARERLREKFPRAALRRMTHLGLLVGAALDDAAFAAADAMVYATTFAETRALEDYLGSFPTPSPLLFQTSIHPSAVQQGLIARQRPLPRLWPITGRARLVEHALLTALLEPAERCVLIGGEERGTWMLDHGMASEGAFAFAVLFTSQRAEASGRVNFSPAKATGETGARDGEPCPSLADLAAALAEKRPLRWRGAAGDWSLAWA